jgi:sortase A
VAPETGVTPPRPHTDIAEEIDVSETRQAAPAPAHVRITTRDTTRTVASAQLNGRGRVRKWDRQPPPHDWRWYVGNVGKAMISVGLLMFGFVAYQLWGTAIETAAAQNELEDEFTQRLADVGLVAPVFEEGPGGSSTPVATDTANGDPAIGDGSEQPDEDVADPTTPDPTGPDIGADIAAPISVAEQNIPDFENGDALARIEIPRIGVDDYVVAGVETRDLKKGPGHFPDTPLPGQLGNAAIAGHRTTYGQPFRNVDQLEPGDEIRVTTLSGVFVYRVTGQQIVDPEDYEVVSTSDPSVATLTLTSCDPVFEATRRIVISSELDSAASGPVGEPLLNYGRPDEQAAPGVLPGANDPTDDAPVASSPSPTSEATDQSSGNLDDDAPTNSVEQPATTAADDNIADAFSESWFSDPAANPQVGVWGLGLAAISIGAYMVSRRLRRDWAGLLVGIVPFVVTLYFFFQNVNRLLPPNL